MMKIAIIDYGLGNLRSVIRGLEKAGAHAVITSEKDEIAAADGLVLPGVGAFHEGMDQLGPLKNTVMESAHSVPLLGICLGMQMLMDTSEEHGFIRDSACTRSVKHFPAAQDRKFPIWAGTRCSLNSLITRSLPGSAGKNMSTLSIPFMQKRDLNLPLQQLNISVPLRRVCERHCVWCPVPP